MGPQIVRSQNDSAILLFNACSFKNKFNYYGNPQTLCTLMTVHIVITVSYISRLSAPTDNSTAVSLLS